MNRSKFDLPSQLRAILIRDSPQSSTALQRATGSSQASISMALAAMGRDIHKLGAARSTRYALTEHIFGLPAQQALCLGGPHPDAGQFGTLTMLHGNRLHVCGPRRHEWLSDGKLPWWLSTLCPQGYLGRRYARLRPDFPVDPDQWTLAQVLYIATNHVADPPGAFSIAAVTPALGRELTVAERGDAFDHLADAATHGFPPGSSAGGEQPKFVARVGEDHVIVKFSPPRGTPFGERWHDLLQLEHLALEVLRENGVDTARTTVVQTGQRTYLQATRFDRPSANGKRHVVAASAIHDAFINTPRRHWVASAEALCADGMLDTKHLRSIASSYLFGQYIGNTDMHFGNLSFFVDDVTHPVFEPTPVYDMLPMMWRPGIHSGELGTQAMTPQIQPEGFDAQAAEVRKWARGYWRQAAELKTLSPGLRAASLENARMLQSRESGHSVQNTA